MHTTGTGSIAALDRPIAGCLYNVVQNNISATNKLKSMFVFRITVSNIVSFVRCNEPQAYNGSMISYGPIDADANAATGIFSVLSSFQLAHRKSLE